MKIDRKGYGRRVAALATAAVLVVMLVMLSAGRVEPVHAAAIAVTTTQDVVAADGFCSLREALINAANDDQSGSNSCAPGGESDVITFAVAGTILLDAPLPPVTGDVTLDGSGQPIIISGQNSVAILSVTSGATLSVNALTIADGKTIGDGGAIANSGTLTVTKSTFTGNSARYGGALFNQGEMIVVNSTFHGNSAAFGGGVMNWMGASAEIGNSTLAENSASSSGGGLYNAWLDGVGGTLTLFNTLLAGNTAGASGGDCVNAGGPFIVDAFNIDSDGSCADATTYTLAQVKLGALADNGGSTMTRALLEGSVAIDAGDNAHCPEEDQRGVARAQGLGCDVGAYEVEKTTVDLYLPVIMRD